MHLDNEIMLNPATYASENIGSTDRFGADVRLAYELEHFGASTAWAFVSAKFDGGEYGGSRVPLVPAIVSTTRAWVRPVEFWSSQWNTSGRAASTWAATSPIRRKKCPPSGL